MTQCATRTPTRASSHRPPTRSATRRASSTPASTCWCGRATAAGSRSTSGTTGGHRRAVRADVGRRRRLRPRALLRPEGPAHHRHRLPRQHHPLRIQRASTSSSSAPTPRPRAAHRVRPHGWKTAEVDPLGNATRWVRRPRGRTVETERRTARRSGSPTTPRATSSRSRTPGSRWVYERDDAGRLITLLDPVGRRTGTTTAVGRHAGRAPRRAHARLTYDARLNLTAAGCDGAPTVTARFDRPGPGGARERRARGVLRARPARPDRHRAGADGEDCRRRARPGGVTALRDRRGTTRYGYTAFRRLALEARSPRHRLALLQHRERARGRGERRGEVHAERDARRPGRRRGGRSTAPSGATRTTPPGASRRRGPRRRDDRVLARRARPVFVEALAGDGRAERFVWSPAGALMEAHSADAAVRWERDAPGGWCASSRATFAVESRWGAGARRSAVASSLGARMAIERWAGDARAVRRGRRVARGVPERRAGPRARGASPAASSRPGARRARAPRRAARHDPAGLRGSRSASRGPARARRRSGGRGCTAARSTSATRRGGRPRARG